MAEGCGGVRVCELACIQRKESFQLKVAMRGNGNHHASGKWFLTKKGMDTIPSFKKRGATFANYDSF